MLGHKGSTTSPAAPVSPARGRWQSPQHVSNKRLRLSGVPDDEFDEIHTGHLDVNMTHL